MNKPIRVLQVIGIMDRGGAETMIMNLYRHIDRNIVQFDFVENENDGAYFDEEIRSLGGQIYHCPRFTGMNYSAYKRWWKHFFDTHNDYSIVHGHIGSTAAFYLKEAEKHGIVTIAHSHSAGMKDMKQFFYDILSYPTRNIADYLFMCSRQAGISRYGEQAISDPKRALLLPNAIDAEVFRYDRNLAGKKRHELAIDDDVFVVGHVGRFIDAKNHSFLLDIFKEFVSIRSSARLLIVGDGPLRSSIEEKIFALGLEDKVILTGMRSDVNELMMAMDVLVFPSLYEGLPVTLVEAQCNGLPCVISDKVPSDSILVPELVQVHSLNDTAAKWAETALDCKCEDRTCCADKVKAAGFDIEENAKWLEEFYLEKAR